MQLDRYGTGKISGWQAALVLIPLLGIGIIGAGALLVYFATHGKWAAFGVLLGAEVAGLAAGGYVYLNSRGGDHQAGEGNAR